MAKQRNITSPIPAGIVWHTASPRIPEGWLPCDGSLKLISEYPELFEEIGTFYNTGGETEGTFRLPDGRQRFILGLGLTAPGRLLGEYGGSIDHKHDLPAHFHGIGDGSDLEISNGAHETSLEHDHLEFDSGLGTPHTHTNTLEILQGTPHTHTHNLNTDIVNPHQHAINHTHHRLIACDEGSHSLDFPNGGPALSNASFVREIITDSYEGNTDFSGVHSHSLVGHLNAESEHTHDLSGGIDLEQSHKHPIKVPLFSGNSSSDGRHTHTKDDISGRIGQVTNGVDGNLLMTSGSSNPPYLTLNFIIKY